MWRLTWSRGGLELGVAALLCGATCLFLHLTQPRLWSWPFGIDLTCSFQQPILLPLLTIQPLQTMTIATPSLVAGGIICTYVFLRVLLHFTQDAREPPAIESGIPFISPIIGMIRQKSGYYIRLRSVASNPKDPVWCTCSLAGAETRTGCQSTPFACHSRACTLSTPPS